MVSKIGLALSGGGVRGFAHLGVLKVFKKHGIPVHAVAGTSAGAIAAALFAAGVDLDMAERLLLSIDLKKFLNVKLHRTGFVDGKNLADAVRLLTRNKNIEDADIPLRIVAADLIEKEVVVFDKGNIAEAVRASVAIPGIFIPVIKDGRMLVDGSILNNCPDDVVRNMGADIIIAVNLEAETNHEPSNVFEVVIRSLELMSRVRAPVLAHVVISPIIDSVGQLEFSRGADCLQMGETAAEGKIAEIEKLL